MTWYDPKADWTYADRRLITARCLVLWPVIIVVAALFVVLGIANGWGWTIGAGGVLIVGLWLSWLIYRSVTAHAWAEREDDLIVKRGRMWRSVTVVPYGRMQFVEVNAGPLARAFGLATIQLHTASPGTDASLSGVRAQDAETLRDRMTSRGEARLAGL